MSTVKILGKHDVKESDQLVEDVKGVGVGDDTTRRSLEWYAIDPHAMARTFEEAAKLPAPVSVSK